MPQRVQRRRMALHRRIREVLERQIRGGGLRPGARLPSEAQIMARFGVSRHVVRLALAELSKEGLIRKQQGRGTFANPPKEVQPITTLVSYHRRMAQRGLDADIKVLRNRAIRPTRAVAARLGLGSGERAIELLRAARLRGEPALLMVSYLPFKHCPGVLNQDLQRGSLYDYLEKACGIRPARAENHIEVEFANREQARYLGVPPGSVLLLMEGVVYDDRERPVELSRIFYRGDRFRLFFKSFRREGTGPGVITFES